MMKLKTLLLVAAFISGASLFAVAGDGELGFCTHLMHKPSDAVYIDGDLDAMKALGTKWVRTDSFWLHQEKSPGVYDWAHSDRIVDAVEKRGMKLCWVTIGSLSSIPPFYKPLLEHLPEMDRYFRALAARYKGRGIVYEISNEPDGGSPLVTLGNTKDPAVYVKFLEVAAKAIRETDPDAVIISAGLTETGADVYPYGYMETLLKNGMANYVDAIAIHPYSNSHTPESFYPHRLKALRELLNRYGAEKLPIWGTETGSSYGIAPVWSKFYPAAFQKAGIKPEKTILTVIYDNKHNFHSETPQLNRGTMGVKFAGVEVITVDKVGSLPANRVLLWPATRLVPPGSVEGLEKFVRRGGCVIFPWDLPLYTFHHYTQDGTPGATEDCNDKYMQQLHVGWDTYWTRKGEIPVDFHNVTGPGFDKLKLNGRILSPKNLKGNDKLIPIVEAEHNGKRFPVAGVFKFNSDFKGSVIMTTASFFAAWTKDTETFTKILPRMTLLLRACGVEKTFLYKIRAFDHEKQWTFGIVSTHPRRYLLPPAVSFMAMMEAMPDNSKVEIVRNGNPWIIKAKRPDGKTAWAIWNEVGTSLHTFDVQGKVQVCFNHNGERRDFQNGKQTVTDAPVYIVGPENIMLK